MQENNDRTDLAFFTALGDMACWMIALEEWKSH